MSDPYQNIIDTLTRSKRVMITTHAKPDGDALGSTAALVLGLRKKNIDAEMILFGDLPRKYAFIYEEHGINFHVVEPAWPQALVLADFDCLLVADTGTWSQLPGLREKVEEWNVPKLVVDHHLTQEDWASHKLVVTTAAAAGEIVAELFERWGVALDVSMATVLYVAIATDTGWFQFSNTQPRTLRLAAKLMEAGVNTDRLYQLLYQNERSEKVALQARALQSLELLGENRLAVMTIYQSDFKLTGASTADTENLINIPLQIATVEASIVLTESAPSEPIRVSLRSKGKIDVARFAEQFGGGGHARAAGLKISGEMQVARARLVSEILRML